MPRPGGTENSAPSCQKGPGAAPCPSIFQFAEFTACQIPFKSGLPSFVRGARYGWASWAGSTCVCAWHRDVKITASKTPEAAKPAIMFAERIEMNSSSRIDSPHDESEKDDRRRQLGEQS